MADPEQDPERLLRVGAMKQKLMEATVGHTVFDVQTAVANMVAHMAVSHPTPEVTVLTTIEIISEVFRAYLARQREGAPVKEGESLN